MAGAIGQVSDKRIQHGVQHQAERKADAHQRGRQAHHGVVKKQHEQPGQDHQNGDGHLAHAVEQLGGKRQWTWDPRRVEEAAMTAGVLMGVRSKCRSGTMPGGVQRASTTSPELSRTGSRKNSKMCPVSKFGLLQRTKMLAARQQHGFAVGQRRMQEVV